MEEKLKKLKSKANAPLSRAAITVKLDASINEKLLHRRIVADKLNEEQEVLQSKLKDKVETVRKIKEGFKKKEEELLYSIQLIDTYMREIQLLKRNADDMYEKLDLENLEMNLKYFKLERENKEILDRNQKIEKFLEYYRCFNDHLQGIITEMLGYENVKELVNYYLVLEVLREELLEKEKIYEENEAKLVAERKQLDEEAKTFPLKILEKENIMYTLRINNKNFQDHSNELEQELDYILSENVTAGEEWHDTDRWIEKIFRKIHRQMPLVPDTKEPKSALKQLNETKDFVWMATECLKRLKLKTK